MPHVSASRVVALAVLSVLLLAATPSPTPTATPVPTLTPTASATPALVTVVSLSEVQRILQSQSDFACWALILTGVTALILLATVVVTARMASATELMATKTKRLADIAAAQLDASLRPWVFPVEFALEDGPMPHIMVIRYKLRNHTDASAVRCVANVTPIQRIGSEMHAGRMDSLSGPLPIGPRSDVRNTAEMSFTLSDGTVGMSWRAIFIGDGTSPPLAILQVAVTTHYESIADKRYWTYTCGQYDPKRNDFLLLKYEEGTEPADNNARNVET